ncbi:alpha/beta hydrolase [Microtetraspora sp. NBRC 13810]|uniref:alpha/beta fold hydrolase n=1 Tax=Microtetraspora sp. NBRC 13810 TaxID=3030990 RepID=UPI0024A2FE41|nr:alpha/beta fold hydrolase [Microtetraspora sp. NBRC 13810]GLW11273.1 alpha/beta hydrolase [Microtetraspora sp. NBRC 13810]
MPYVSTRAGRVHYRERGEGTPVVMLHATLHDHHDFDAVAPGLAERYRTITVDWPWHGESESPRAPQKPGVTLFAEVLQDVVTNLGLPPAFFIGNSVGGFSAARLAITHPDRVRGLVMVNAGGFVSWNPLTRSSARLLGVPSVTRLLMPRLVNSYMRARTPEDAAIVRRVVARAKTREGARTAAAIWREFPTPGHDLRGRVGELRAPTLLVWGALDPVLPLRAGRVTHETIPGSRLEVFQAGHVVFSSEPDAFLAVVRSFFETVTGGDSFETVTGGDSR